MYEANNIEEKTEAQAHGKHFYVVTSKKKKRKKRKRNGNKGGGGWLQIFVRRNLLPLYFKFHVNKT